MNRHAQKEAQKTKPTMTNVEATDKPATVAEQGAHVAPESAPSKKGASRKKGAPRGQKAAKAAKPTKTANASRKATKPERKATAPRADTKGDKIVEMIGRAKGATLAEIMKAIAWQAHSVRGFLSITAKKQGIKIESSKNQSGGRVYRIAN
jgi:Protein of unknown function (DUF3489)